MAATPPTFSGMPQSFETEMARELFYEQMERYRNLNDSLDLPAAVIPLYMAALLFFVDRLTAFWPAVWSWNRSTIVYIVFFVVVVVFSLFIFLASWRYCVTIWNYQNATVLAAPADMNKWFSELKVAHPDADIETYTDAFLGDDYITAAQATFSQNESRSDRMFRCRRNLIVALVLTAMAMACYYSSSLLQPSEAKSNGQTTSAPT